MLISCQGGEYTTEVYAPLRKNGWKGYWIDAASTLRMSDDAVIILDPVNGERDPRRAWPRACAPMPAATAPSA